MLIFLLLYLIKTDIKSKFLGHLDPKGWTNEDFLEDTLERLWHQQDSCQKYFGENTTLLRSSELHVVQAHTYFQYIGLFVCLTIKDK